MRIAIDIRPLKHPRSGIGRYTWHILNGLTHAGHDIIECDAPAGKLSQLVTSQVKFANIAKRGNADLYWSPRHHLPTCLSLPSVVTIHDLVWWRKPETMPLGNRVVDSYLSKKSIAKASKVIAVSHATKSDIVALDANAKDKIEVIHEASTLDKPAVPPKPLVSGKYILAVGTIEPRKNYARLIKAFLSLNLPDLKLVIAGGSGWGNVSIPDHASLAVLRDTTDNDLISLYTHAEFVLVPSLYEGFGLQLTEALTFGKAIITSDNSSMPEVAGDAAIYVQPESTAAIAKAIEKLALSPDFRLELAANALKRSAQFSWEHAVEQTIALFEKVSGSAA